MRKWEYHVRFLDTSTDEQSILDDLNHCGREGWELVAVTPHESAGVPRQVSALRDRDPLGGLTPAQIVSSAVLVAMFKRPVKPEPTEPVLAPG